MTKRERREIEWHFINHAADLGVYEDKAGEILDEGLTARLSRSGRGSLPGNPTEVKALRLAELVGQKNWASAVRNTFRAFRFHPCYRVMTALYVEGKSRQAVLTEYFKGGALETTFWRWREKWLTFACQWAREYGLL